MIKMTIQEAAQKLGVSKEAIHNRIRRGSLESIIENGIKLVFLDLRQNGYKKAKRVSKNQNRDADERYYGFLEEQNIKLQQKVENLQNETRMLRDQKEQLLVREREKIESIYKEKDEQLKSILNALSSKFMLHAPPLESEAELKEDLFEAEIQEHPDTAQRLKKRLIPLNKYLKTKDLSKKKQKKIKAKFQELAEEDPRIITIEKKLYIDLQRYDYSDFSL